MYLHKYVEKLASEGKISPEARAEIYRGCRDLIKLAEVTADDMHTIGTAMGQAIGQASTPSLGKRLLAASLPAAIGSAFGLVPQVLKITTERGNVASGIAANRMALREDPSLAKYEEKAESRLKELTRASPYLASTPIAQDIVKSRLHSGFTKQDLATFTMAKGTVHPHQYEKYNKWADKKFQGLVKKELRKKEKDMRKQAAEGLGRLYGPSLALVKEASAGFGAIGGIGKAIGSLTKNPEFMGNLKGMGVLMAAPVLYGAGKGALDQYLSSKENKQLRKDLESSFTTAMSKAKSDNRSNLSANKGRARDAFQTLVSVSPSLARDPEATRAFLTAAVNAEVGVPTDLLKNISEIERNLSQAGSYKSGPGYGPMLSGFGAGFAQAGGGELASTAIRDSAKRTSGSMFDELSGKAEEEKQRKAEDAVDRTMARAERYKRLMAKRPTKKRKRP